ncbi:MAG: hypothetical protein ACLF0G_09540 [Candidatus Brocadiia bacterium]
MRRATALWTMAALALAAAGARGGEAPPQAPKAESKVTLSWEDFVRITGYDPTQKGAQRVVVPWAEVEDLIGMDIERVGDGASVALPWSEFKALLQWSLEQKAGVAPPPTDYVVASSQYSGTLGEEAASLKLALSIDILQAKGWKRIPVLPTSVALTEATLPDGVHLNATAEAYELLTQQAGTLQAELSFTVAVTQEKGIHRVNFQRPAPAASLLDLSIEREDVDVEVAGAQSLEAQTADGKTRVMAALPSGVPLSITWERALPEVEPAPTKIYAETRTLMAVAEGVLVCQEKATFNVLHQGIRELALTVPPEVSVLSVVGPNVQDWRVDGGELRVVFRGELLGSQSLDITYERPAADTVEVPVIRGKGVEREKGYVGVVAMTNVEIASGEVTGARSVDVRRLPGELVAMTNQPILLGFRYVGEAFSIPLSIRRHAEVDVLLTIVDSALFTAMQLSDGRRITKVVYNVRNNRNQFLRLQMPKGAEIWSVEVSGNTVSPAKDEEGNVLVPLVRSTRSASELASFPVDMVYVETTDAGRSGTLRVQLPTVAAPMMHVMLSYYLPKEGSYRGLLGGARFSGPLRLVDEFTPLTTTAGAEAQTVDADEQAQQMQKQVEAQVDQRARAAGVQPIRVRLPLHGTLFKLEKILCLRGDELWVEVKYSGWEPAE